jgi:hypothetical protein
MLQFIGGGYNLAFLGSDGFLISVIWVSTSISSVEGVVCATTIVTGTTFTGAKLFHLQNNSPGMLKLSSMKVTT